MLEAQRTAMGMGMGLLRVCRRISEHVVERAVDELQPGAEAVRGRLEHMFVRVWQPPDGTATADHVPVPSDDQTSSLVRSRSSTAVVNSVVPVWPPRSGVLTPAPTVSSADS